MLNRKWGEGDSLLLRPNGSELACSQISLSLSCLYLLDDFIDVCSQCVDALHRLCHFLVQLHDVYHLARVLRLYIRANGEVVIVLGNRVVVHRCGNMLHLVLVSKDADNAFDVFGPNTNCLKSQPSTAPRTSLAILQMAACSSSPCFVFVIMLNVLYYFIYLQKYNFMT